MATKGGEGPHEEYLVEGGVQDQKYELNTHYLFDEHIGHGPVQL